MSPDEAAIERAWHLGRHNNDPFRRSFNVQPTATIPVLRLDPQTRTLELVTARWGLIPYWWKAPAPPRLAFNARLEDAAAKPMWRDALRRTRCLIPAEGWYEWQARERAGTADAAARRYKQPFFIRRRDGRLLCFAGLLAHSPPSSGAALTCAVLTTAAAGTLARIHDRMPVVLPETVHDGWLDAGLTDGAKAAGLARAALATASLEHYPVSTRVNSARVDGPELIEPADLASPPDE